MEKDNLYKKIILNYQNKIRVCDSEQYIDKNNYLSFEEIRYLELKEFDSKIQKELDIIDETGIIFPQKGNNSLEIIKSCFEKLKLFRILDIHNLRKDKVIPKEILIFELSNDLLNLLKFNKNIVFKLILTEYSLREISYTLYFDNLHIINLPENSIRSLFNIVLGKNNYKEEYVHMSESNSVITKSNNLCKDTFLCIKGINHVVFEIPELIFLLNCKKISKTFLKVFIDTIFMRGNIRNHLGVKLILFEKVDYSYEIIINYLNRIKHTELEDSMFRFIFPIELILIKGKGDSEKLNFLKNKILNSFLENISTRRLDLYQYSQNTDINTFKGMEFFKNDNDFKNILGVILLNKKIAQNNELILSEKDLIFFCASVQILHTLKPNIKLVLMQSKNQEFKDIDSRSLPAIYSMMDKEIEEKFVTKDMFLNNFMNLIQFKVVMYSAIIFGIKKGFSPIQNLDILVKSFFDNEISVIDCKIIPFNEIQENYHLLTDHLKLFLLYLIQKSDICDDKHIDLMFRIRKDVLWLISYE